MVDTSPLATLLASVAGAVAYESSRADDGSGETPGAPLATILEMGKTARSPFGAALLDAALAAAGESASADELALELQSLRRERAHFPSAAAAAQWDAVLAPHLLACAHERAGEWLPAFAQQKRALAALNVVLKETAGRWIVPPLLRVAGDAARLCRLADHDARRRGQQDAFRLELNGDQGGDGAEDGSAGAGGGGGGGGGSGAQGSGAVGFSSVLRESFSTCATQKAALLRDAYGQPDYRLNRKIGAVALANLIFRLLFRSQEPRYCKEIQKVMEHDQWFARELGDPRADPRSAASEPRSPFSPEGSCFPVAQLVTYKYYTGKLAILDDKFFLANKFLAFALRYCPREGWSRASDENRRRILRLLVPVRLHVGSLPRPRLLASYGLERVYGGIVRGVQLGDLRSFREAIEANLYTFVRAGTFLLIEKLQMAVLRSLVKRCARLLGNATQMPLPLLAAAMGGVGNNSSFPVDDPAELECLLAGLIFNEFVKGYINHGKRESVLVLKKSGAFPPLAEIVERKMLQPQK